MSIQKASVSVSVVIPCYRCAQTIHRAFSSVEDQTVAPLEVILVDDCSNDGTLVVLEEMAFSSKLRVRVISLERNGGPATARNRGWALARGDAVAFLDADDTWCPNKLEVQYKYLVSHADVDLVGHLCPEPRPGDIFSAPARTTMVKRISRLGILMGNPFSTPTVMIRATVLARFRDGKRSAEDWLLWQTIGLSGGRIVRIELPLASVHKRLYGEGGLSADLWRMETGELENFRLLRETRMISRLEEIVFSVYSLVKFLRRLAIVRFRSSCSGGRGR